MFAGRSAVTPLTDIEGRLPVEPPLFDPFEHAAIDITKIQHIGLIIFIVYLFYCGGNPSTTFVMLTPPGPSVPR